MKEVILKWAFNAIGAICIIVFVLARTNNAHKLIFAKEFQGYGELFNFSSIENFKEELPPKIDIRDKRGRYMGYRLSDKHPPINKADILTFGDSFFYFPRHISFPERLGDSLHLKVFYENYPNPFAVLNKHNYKKGKAKTLIYEIGERGVFTRFGTKMNTQLKDYSTGNDKPFFISLSTQQAEIKYNRLLQKSIFTNKLYSFIATLKFNSLGYISSLTPAYNDSSNFLFFHDTVNGENTSYNYPYSEIEINNTVSNIEFMSNKLKTMYNIDLVFMPIPSKITIYDHMVEMDNYNQLLPELYQKLKMHNVTYIDLYSAFNNSRDTLYYATDTHWNKKGIDKALQTTVELLSTQ